MNNTNVQRRDGLYGFEFMEVDKRRVDSDKRTRYNIKQLWQRSHEIINLAAQGWKNIDIAEILNITPQCVSDTLNSELGKLKLSELRSARDEDAKKQSEKIRILTNKALQTYHEIFDSEDEQVTLKDKKAVADTVLLELSGLRAPTKIQAQSISTILTAEELEEFKNRGRKAAGIIDVEVAETEQPDQNGSDKNDTVTVTVTVTDTINNNEVSEIDKLFNLLLNEGE